MDAGEDFAGDAVEGSGLHCYRRKQKSNSPEKSSPASLPPLQGGIPAAGGFLLCPGGPRNRHACSRDPRGRARARPQRLQTAASAPWPRVAAGGPAAARRRSPAQPTARDRWRRPAASRGRRPTCPPLLAALRGLRARVPSGGPGLRTAAGAVPAVAWLPEAWDPLRSPSHGSGGARIRAEAARAAPAVSARAAASRLGSDGGRAPDRQRRQCLLPRPRAMFDEPSVGWEWIRLCPFYTQTLPFFQ